VPPNRAPRCPHPWLTRRADTVAARWTTPT
jgi:hypothetical protein